MHTQMYVCMTRHALSLMSHLTRPWAMQALFHTFSALIEALLFVQALFDTFSSLPFAQQPLPNAAYWSDTESSADEVEEHMDTVGAGKQVGKGETGEPAVMGEDAHGTQEEGSHVDEAARVRMLLRRNTEQNMQAYLMEKGLYLPAGSNTIGVAGRGDRGGEGEGVGGGDEEAQAEGKRAEEERQDSADSAGDRDRDDNRDKDLPFPLASGVCMCLPVCLSACLRLRLCLCLCF